MPALGAWRLHMPPAAGAGLLLCARGAGLAGAAWPSAAAPATTAAVGAPGQQVRWVTKMQLLRGARKPKPKRKRPNALGGALVAG